MKRYYLCDIYLGATATGQPAWKPTIARDFPAVAHAVVMPPIVEGVPAKNQCLVIIDTINHKPLEVHSTLTPLPDMPLDAKVDAIRFPTRQKMVADIQSKGFAATVASDDTSGYRDIVRDIGKQLDTNFHESSFDVNG